MKILDLVCNSFGEFILLLGDKEIGSSNGLYLIRELSFKEENGKFKIQLIFKNLLGGLYENEHQKIQEIINNSCKLLKGFPVEIYLEPQINADDQNLLKLN